MIDTHAHLDSCGEEAVDRARLAGVEAIVSVGSGLESCRKTLEIVERHSGVFAALGIHPHQAGGEEEGGVDELRGLLAHERAVAVGETGLDYYRDLAPREAQRQLFAEHLALSADLGLPVVVHSRAADTDTAAALEGFAGTVVLHCFSSPELLPAALERGYFVSFAGNVTYPSATVLRDAALRVPAERLLAETDSPYLAPQPVRGRPNEPAHVVHTVALLASVRGLGVRELELQLDANASAAFGLP